jgi:methionine-rich copper-binding protein CopC
MLTIHSRLQAIFIGSATALIMIMLMAAPGLASAHAAYVSSTPAANSILKSAPTTVTITFAENLDPAGLSIAVYDNTGKMVSTGNAQISASDPKTASIAMTGTDSDIYRVDWHTVSATDSDPTLGAFVFGVSTDGQSDKIDAATSNSSSSSGTSPLAIILTGLIGLIVGGGVTYFVTRLRLSQA